MQSGLTDTHNVDLVVGDKVMNFRELVSSPRFTVKKAPVAVPEADLNSELRASVAIHYVGHFVSDHGGAERGVGEGGEWGEGGRRGPCPWVGVVQHGSAGDGEQQQ